MLRNTELFGLLTILCACVGGSAQQPPQAPKVKLQAVLPQALRAAELLFSGDGRKLLVLRHFGSKNEPVLSLHDVATGREDCNALVGSDLFGQGELAKDMYGKAIPTFRQEGVTATMSPNGRMFLTLSFQTVRLWDAATARPIGKAIELDGNVRAIFTSDGNNLLTVCLIAGKSRQDKVRCDVALWDANSVAKIGQSSTEIDVRSAAQEPFVKAVFWTPDEKFFVTACSSWKKEAESIQLWDTKTLLPVGRPLSAAGDYHQFAPDGKTLLVVSKKETAIWDMVNRTRRTNMATPDVSKKWAEVIQRRIQREAWFAVHSNATTIVYTYRGRSQLWDLSGATPQKIAVLEHPEGAYSVAMSRDGKHAATACGAIKGQVLVWDLETAKRVFTIPLLPASFTNQWGQNDGGVKAMAFSPDGRLLAVVDGSGVRIWKLEFARSD
jgi:WD40 repeat protein